MFLGLPLSDKIAHVQEISEAGKNEELVVDGEDSVHTVTVEAHNNE